MVDCASKSKQWSCWCCCHGYHRHTPGTLPSACDAQERSPETSHQHIRPEVSSVWPLIVAAAGGKACRGTQSLPDREQQPECGQQKGCAATVTAATCSQSAKAHVAGMVLGIAVRLLCGVSTASCDGPLSTMCAANESACGTSMVANASPPVVKSPVVCLGLHVPTAYGCVLPGVCTAAVCTASLRLCTPLCTH